MTKTTVFLGVLLACASVPVAFPQQTAPPPSANSGPSLAVTMQFIQDKLNDLGIITFNGYQTDPTTGQTWYFHRTESIVSVVASATTCTISYHMKTTMGLTSMQDGDFGINLRDVQDLKVEPIEVYLTGLMLDSGHVDTSTQPKTWVLLARRPHNALNYLVFQDDALANRVAKAMVHAVELCGGGSKDPF